MWNTFARVAFPCLALFLLGCGGGSSAPVLVGPFIIDFEDRPDDGFNTVPTPLVLAPGVTATETSAGADIWDFSTADGWGLAGCDATAISGILMIGVDGTAPVSVTIVFDTPVSRVRAFVSEIVGATVSMEAFDQGGSSLGMDAQVSACPALELTDVVDFDAGANTIKSVVFTGDTDLITMDDLSYWRFQ